MLKMETPLTVTARGGETTLLVMDAKDGLPAAFALMATRAAHRVALRLGGGCKGMNAADKTTMLEYFDVAFRGYRGLVWSGGTRQLASDGSLDPMVTDVPGIIAAANPECVALGTMPRTDLLRLAGDSQLVLDKYGTRPNPTVKGLLVVQNGADGNLDWDGDLNAYFGLMEQWRDHAGFTALGLIAWNGGPVTEKEIMRSAKLGWPTFLVSGTGRVTDELIGKLAIGTLELPKQHRVVVVSKDNPSTLRGALIEHGFLVAT